MYSVNSVKITGIYIENNHCESIMDWKYKETCYISSEQTWSCSMHHFLQSLQGIDIILEGRLFLQEFELRCLVWKLWIILFHWMGGAFTTAHTATVHHSFSCNNWLISLKPIIPVQQISNAAELPSSSNFASFLLHWHTVTFMPSIFAHF